jgi:hypothetical protein
MTLVVCTNMHATLSRYFLTTRLSAIGSENFPERPCNAAEGTDPDDWNGHTSHPKVPYLGRYMHKVNIFFSSSSLQYFDQGTRTAGTGLGCYQTQGIAQNSGHPLKVAGIILGIQSSCSHLVFRSKATYCPLLSLPWMFPLFYRSTPA